jgi:hypothetical protein
MEQGAKQPLLACEDAVNAYLKDVDRTLIRENLKLSYEERAIKMYRFARAMEEVRGIARKTHGSGQVT